MASKIYHLIVLSLLLTLVIIGLNTSNEAINQVSRESRGPVAFLQWQDHVLHVDWLGRGYDYPLQRFMEDMGHWRDQVNDLLIRSRHELGDQVQATDYDLVSSIDR
ncbi:MAG TPA: hypothetical protein VN426_01710 [Syntrophomonadaceae bacterium]|nr:hypothetical protein [Syntrophomonadaceae bacterium]